MPVTCWAMPIPGAVKTAVPMHSVQKFSLLCFHVPPSLFGFERYVLHYSIFSFQAGLNAALRDFVRPVSLVAVVLFIFLL